MKWINALRRLPSRVDDVRKDRLLGWLVVVKKTRQVEITYLHPTWWRNQFSHWADMPKPPKRSTYGTPKPHKVVSREDV